VAERYEVVCDLSSFEGETLYLWNNRDERLADVPYFCWSHLVMRMDVAATATSGAAARWAHGCPCLWQAVRCMTMTSLLPSMVCTVHCQGLAFAVAAHNAARQLEVRAASFQYSLGMHAQLAPFSFVSGMASHPQDELRFVALSYAHSCLPLPADEV
jgi:hypothetical protein